MAKIAIRCLDRKGCYRGYCVYHAILGRNRLPDLPSVGFESLFPGIGFP